MAYFCCHLHESLLFHGQAVLQNDPDGGRPLLGSHSVDSHGRLSFFSVKLLIDLNHESVCCFYESLIPTGSPASWSYHHVNMVPICDESQKVSLGSHICELSNHKYVHEFIKL